MRELLYRNVSHVSRSECRGLQHMTGFRSASTSTGTSPRWLTDVQTRIGSCITFGLNRHQIEIASDALRTIARDWRELVAGSEGYLTSADRRGLYRQGVVWGDMDSMVRHVNNVRYNKWAESGRVIWSDNFARIDPENAAAWSDMCTPRGTGLILKSIRTDFKFPMKYPDRVTVYHRLASEPSKDTDVFALDVLILSERHRRAAARCVEEVVVYDYRAGTKTPLPSFMLDAFRRTWILQQEAKSTYSKKAQEIMASVRKLEQESWDRPDAIEDNGGR